MTTLHNPHQHLQQPPPARVETVGDGMSAAALITAWVGATVPLLPGVALLVAIAGRKRALTRWLSTVAIVVSAVFLAVQVIIALAFGSAIITVVDRVMNRDAATSTVSSPALDELVPQDLEVQPSTPADVTPSESSTAPDDTGDTDMSQASTTMPGVDATLDGAYLDNMSSALEDSGFALSDFDQNFLYRVAGDTCKAMDDGSTLDEQAQAINDQDIPRAISGTIATVAIVTYCPQHYNEL